MGLPDLFCSIYCSKIGVYKVNIGIVGSNPTSPVFKLHTFHADMAELADAPDLGSGGDTRAGSSPVIRIF